MIKVLVVDDEAIVRQGIVSLLTLEPDLEIVGQAQNGAKAIELARSLDPAVILMDIRMPVCDGIQALQQILKEKPTIKVVMLTTFDDDSIIADALRIGACGYLLKDTDSVKIAAAIRMVSQGLALLNAPVLKKLSRGMSVKSGAKASPLSKLSPREIDVLRLLGQGKNNKQIAAALFLTEGTVKNYVSKIFEQLGVRSRFDAIAIAKQQLDDESNNSDSPYIFS
jgi:DNA-binding NarL/FixJ family response regulator